MAEIVLGIGSSHSPMLGSPPEDYPAHAEIDRGETDWKRRLYDKYGREASYDELLSQADPAIASQVEPAAIREKSERCQRDVDRLAQAIADACLDTLIVVGDDQHEQFHEDNMPAILVYWGETITNNVLDLSADSPEFWKRARAQYHETDGPREYPVDSALGHHIIERLTERGFDVSQSQKLPRARGEGHAFGFVHRRLMTGKTVPIVPISLNTYFPPNQPTPTRCHALGAAIAEAVADCKTDKRVGILASGGLSHFAVNEALDRKVLKACREKDRDTLTSLPPNEIASGSSEIRNWIAVAGATAHLDVSWWDYVPCYRSPAGTGVGMGFAIWS